MKIKNFVKVNSLEEAYNLLQEDSSNLIVGGGAWLKLTNKEVGTMIDLENLELDTIVEDDSSITIGAMTLLRDIEISKPIVDLANGILANAVKGIMGISIRNIATLGGSIMGRYSFSDILTPLLVLDVDLTFYKAGTMSLADFLDLKKIDDILVSITIKKKEYNGYFYSMKKTSLDFAVVNVAVTKSDLVDIAIGARPSLSVKPVKAIEFINKQDVVDEGIIEEAAEIAIEEIKFGTNSRASKEYRESITKTYIMRGLKEVFSNES